MVSRKPFFSLKKVFSGAAAAAVALTAVHFVGINGASAADVLDPTVDINGKKYVFSSDYATRVNYGASTENEKQEKSHFVIQNGAMIEKVVDPEAEKAGKVHWRATFNRDRLNNYGTDNEALESASAHTSNPYFNITLSKGLKFANDQVGIITYWRDTDNKIVSTSSGIVKMPPYKGDPDTESVKNFKHPKDPSQYLENLWYYNEPNDYAPPFGSITGVYDGNTTFSSLAQYLRCSVRSEFDPSNEGPRPRMGGFSWAKSMGDFSKLSNKKLFNDTYAGTEGNSNKASTALSLKYHTEGTSTSAKKKNATVVVDFLTEFDPAYKGDAANKDHFVMAHYKSYDDNSDFNRGDIIKFAPVENAAPTVEKWNVKVDETAKDPAKVVPSHRLVINTNGAGTFQNEVKNTTGANKLTKDYVINSTVAATSGVDPVYVQIADVDGKVLPFNDNIGAPEKPRTGTYGGYDFTVKQASPYNYDGRQSHWAVEWTKRADHGNGFLTDYVKRVKIINPPTKIDYKVGEPFDATGMMVELTDEGGNKLIVTPDEFDKYKLKMDPANQSKLNNEGKDLPVTVSYIPNETIKDTTPINVGAGDDAGKYTPEVKTVDTKKGEVPNPASQITNKHGDPVVADKTNLPDGTKFEYTDKDGNPTQPDVSKSGDVPTFIKVTYPDKSFEIVPATIHVNTDAEQWRKDNTDENGKFTGKGTATVEQGNPVDPAKVTVTPELPAGAKVTEVGTVDTTTPTEKDKPRTTTGKVVFADGSEIADLPVEVTVTPKAATGDPVIVVTDDTKPAPEGYVRMTFDAAEGAFADGSKKVTLDVKKDITGKDLKSDKNFPKNPALDGKEFDKWTPELPADDAKIDDNTAKDYKATYKAATTTELKTPDVVEPKSGDKVVKVGVPDDADTVVVTLPNGKTVTAKKDDKGKWATEDGTPVPVNDGKLEIPTGDPLKADEKVTVQNQKDGNKSPEKTVTVVPSEADKYKKEHPEGKGTITVKKNENPDPSKVTVTPALPDGAKVTEIAKVDTSNATEDGKPLKTTGTVVFKDGSKIENFPIEVTVSKGDADKYTPEVDNKTIEEGQPAPKPEDMIKNKSDLPAGTKYEYAETPDVSTPGEHPVKIKVTYPDGTSEVVDGKITVSKKEDGAPAKPVVETPKAGDKEVKVTTPTDAHTVEVKLPNGDKVTVTKDDATNKWTTADGTPVKEENGKLLIPVPELKTGDKVTVTNSENGKSSTPTEVTVESATPTTPTNPPAKPDVETPQPGDEVVKVKVPNDAPTINVTLPDGKVVTVKKDGDKWKTGTGVEVPVKDGKLEIPTGKPLQPGDTIKVETNNGKPSEPTTVTVPEASAPAKPLVDTPKDGDKVVKVGVPTDADTVEVTLPNGDKVTVKKDGDTWKTDTGEVIPVKDGKLEIPTGTPLKAGDKVTVVNKKDGKSSTPTEVTVESATPTTPTNPPAKPDVETPQPGDEVVKVKVPNDAPTINVTLPDGKVVTVKKDGDKWKTGTGVEVPVKDGKLEIPTGKPLQPGDTIKVETNNGKPSEPTTVTVPMAPGTEKPAKPEVKPIKPGDNSISVGVPSVGDVIYITLPDGTVTGAEKNQETGKWVTEGGAEVPVVDGYLVIPVDPSKTTEGGKVVVVVENGDLKSDPTEVIIKSDAPLPAAPGSGKPVPNTGVGIDWLAGVAVLSILAGAGVMATRRNKNN